MLTGAFVQGGAKNVPAFEAWLGQPLGVVNDFVPFELPDWWLNLWKSTRYAGRMMATVNMLPKDPLTGKVTGTIQRGASGEYDAQWRSNAQRLIAARMLPWLRIGHEPNGEWAAWYAGNDPEAWLAYYRRIVNVMRATGGAFRFALSPSAGWSGFDPLAIFDRNYVDLLAIDFYDSVWAHPGLTPQQRWAIIANADHHGGLNFWTEFAQVVGKPIAVAETGLVNTDAKAADGTSRGGGGDDPYFIQHLHDWAATNNALFVCYQNADAKDGLHRLDTGHYPQSAALFKQLFAKAA